MARNRRSHVGTAFRHSRGTRLGGGLAVAICLWSGVALAQQTDSQPGVIVPPGGNATPRSGVLPAPSVDPSMQVKPPVPSAGLPTPVIPPPGSPGGNPLVVPK